MSSNVLDPHHLARRVCPQLAVLVEAATDILKVSTFDVPYNFVAERHEAAGMAMDCLEDMNVVHGVMLRTALSQYRTRLLFWQMAYRQWRTSMNGVDAADRAAFANQKSIIGVEHAVKVMHIARDVLVKAHRYTLEDAGTIDHELREFAACLSQPTGARCVDQR